MKYEYTIGNNRVNDIVLKNKVCPDFHAKITYKQGEWILSNLVPNEPIFVNAVALESPKKLNKSDKIIINNQTIYWCDYLYEGEQQDIHIQDLFTYHGRISRSNFRTLSLLALGMTFCVFFLPGLLSVAISGRASSRETLLHNTELFTPLIYTLGFSIITLIMLILAIKRMRDTRNPLWKLLIPVYNLKILFFDSSSTL